MSDIEHTASDLIFGARQNTPLRLRPSLLKAIIRLAGQALAEETDHEEAFMTYTQLGRQHFQRSVRRRFR